MDNPETEISQLLSRETVGVRKAAKGTHPNLFYINGDEASLNPIATEKPEYTLWSAQERGVGHFAKDTEKLAFSGDSILKAALESNGSPTTAKELSNTNGGLKSVDVLMGDARRVYDAPDKGLLWGWEVSAYVWTKAIAAGAFLVPVLAFAFPELSGLVSLELIGMGVAGIMLAFIFLALTGILLIKDLDQPKRFLYVLLRPQWNSWLVKGAYSITAYGGFLTLLVLASVFGWTWLSAPAFWLAAAAGVLTAVYTAFLFAQAKGRDFWQSSSLALHMLVHSFMAGAAALAFVGSVSGAPDLWFGFLKNVMLVSIALNLLTMLVELTISHPTEDARLVVKMITRGRYANLFWWIVVLLGNIVPFAALISGAGGALPIASALVLFGIYFTEKIWVEAPQRIQLS
jgi:formate-dependent nitrite reductase membrane component NrfD